MTQPINTLNPMTLKQLQQDKEAERAKNKKRLDTIYRKELNKMYSKSKPLIQPRTNETL